MKKYRMRATNSINPAKWNIVKLTHKGNPSTNSVITTTMFNRECGEYDAGTLPFEHDRYLGESHE